MRPRSPRESGRERGLVAVLHSDEGARQLRRPASRGKAKREAPARAKGAVSHERRHLDPGKPPSLTCPRQAEIRRLEGIRLAVFNPDADQEVSEAHGRQGYRSAENAPELLAKCGAQAQRTRQSSIGPKPARVPSSNAAARDRSSNAGGFHPTGARWKISRGDVDTGCS